MYFLGYLTFIQALLNAITSCSTVLQYRFFKNNFLSHLKISPFRSNDAGPEVDKPAVANPAVVPRRPNRPPLPPPLSNRKKSIVAGGKGRDSINSATQGGLKPTVQQGATTPFSRVDNAAVRHSGSTVANGGSTVAGKANKEVFEGQQRKARKIPGAKNSSGKKSAKAVGKSAKQQPPIDELPRLFGAWLAKII